MSERMNSPVFEALLQQIMGLESAQREQDAKLAAEVARHNTTKAEHLRSTSFLPLSFMTVTLCALAASRLEERWKRKVAEMQACLASVKADLVAQEKRNGQLKESAKNLTSVANHQLELMQKTTDDLKQERYVA